MKNLDFDSLLDRYLKGRASTAEREKIDAWMDVMKTIDPHKKVLTYEDEDKLFKCITSETTTVADIMSFKPAAWQHQRVVSNSRFRITAGIVLLLGLLFFAWMLFG